MIYNRTGRLIMSKRIFPAIAPLLDNQVYTVLSEISFGDGSYGIQLQGDQHMVTFASVRFRAATAHEILAAELKRKEAR